MAHCARFIRFGPYFLAAGRNGARTLPRRAVYILSLFKNGIWMKVEVAGNSTPWVIWNVGSCFAKDVYMWPTWPRKWRKNTSYLIVLPVIPTQTKYLTMFLTYHLTFWHITWQFIYGMHILPFYLTFFLANRLTFFLASYLLSILAFYLTSILA